MSAPRPGPAAAMVLACALAWLLAVQAAAGEAEEPQRFRLRLRPLVEELPFTVHGFFETRAGVRTQQDRYVSKTATMAESRLQLELSRFFDWAEFRTKADFYYDDVVHHGETELREAYVLFTPLSFMDVKAGRQVLTWGTGDLLFINDLFPKDWEAFFIGRDVEYLKAPSDAVKASVFTDLANLDLVYAARFLADNTVDGQRLSYWSDALGRRAGEDPLVRTEEPSNWLDDEEFALRLFRNFGGTELALYAYRGFWPQPAGVDPATGRATYPKLSAYGASARGQLFKGIANAEVGYYDSRDDDGGDDPLVRNSELRVLVGYKQEVARELTAGVQYYVEWMMDYGGYKDRLPPGVHPRDEARHVLTLRLTQLLMRQNLTLSMFTYYSPSDDDAYLRPRVHYKITDHWAAEAGGNLFLGAHDHTFFGMFERDTNVYLSLRYSF
ncbi:MAG: hypothetical protein ACLF0G_15670 [Candidatus Brocadiia bacterium]